MAAILELDYKDYTTPSDLKIKSLANLVHYNIVRKHGNVICKLNNSEFKTNDDIKYFNSFGISIGSLLPIDSTALGKLLIIPKEHVNGIDDYLASLDDIDSNYTHFLIEHTYTNFKELEKAMEIIDSYFDNGLIDLVDRSELYDKNVINKENIKSYMYDAELSNLLIYKFDSEGRGRSLSFTNKELGFKGVGVAIDISDLVQKLSNDVITSNKIMVSYQTIYQSLMNRIANIKKLLASKGNVPLYLVCYNEDEHLLRLNHDSIYSNIAASLLAMFLYQNSHLKIYPMLTGKQKPFYLDAIRFCLYNPNTMFMENRLEYLTNYPHLSFIDRGNAGMYQVIAYYSQLKLDVTFIAESEQWRLNDKQEVMNSVLTLNDIELLSIAEDFIDVDEYSPVWKDYLVKLSVLESSINDSRLYDVLKMIKFTYKRPLNEADENPNIDYDRVYYGIVNDIDFELTTDLIRLTIGLDKPQSIRKVFKEGDVNRLLPACFFKGYENRVANAKAIIEKRHNKPVHNFRTGFVKCTSPNAIMINKVQKLKTNGYNVKSDNLNVVEQGLYSDEAIKTRANINTLMQGITIPSKTREYCNAINCFGFVSLRLNGTFSLSLDALSRF